MIYLKNIVQTYVQGSTTVEVFKNLNLSIKSSENIGIIGPSGSGKTSLLNIIALLENPISGKIEISGVDCNSLKSEEKVEFRKNNIGFIFQNNQLLEDLSVEENVALPLILDGLSYKKSIEKSVKILEFLGVKERKSFKPGLLSGGEQQRVAIARAMIKEPLVLIADEPTGSLDDKNSKIVFDFIIKLAREKNIITIFATHNLKLIEKLDKCYKIREGDLIEFKKK